MNAPRLIALVPVSHKARHFSWVAPKLRIFLHTISFFKKFSGKADIIRGFMVSLYVKGKENGEVMTIRNETTYPIHGKYPLKR